MPLELLTFFLVALVCNLLYAALWLGPPILWLTLRERRKVKESMRDLGVF